MAPSSDTLALRAFSRFYTRQIDLLNEGLLASPHTLAESRVLYEIANRDGITAGILGQDLGLDAGYLSRVLKRLRDGGLVRRHEEPAADGRTAPLGLTEAGRAAFAALDRASDTQAGSMLAGLGPEARGRLVSAMRAVEDLLTRTKAEPPVTLRPHGVGDIGWIAHRQSLLYAAEYGFDATFEALVAEIGARFVREFQAGRERCWIAERQGAIVGSVFLCRQDDATAKLRLLYVEPAARGFGIGGMLIAACIAFAREAGYATLDLWTNDVLSAARHLYGQAGFRLVASEPHHSFGRDLVGETWRLDLAQA